MKTSYKYSILILTVGILLTVTSCKKTFYTNANVDPNAPAAVPPSTLLPTAEAGLAYTQGGNMSLFTSLFMQQTNGVANQAQFYYQYTFKSSDAELLWDPMYCSAMENDYALMKLADSKSFNEYSGISRILMAYTLQTMVDCWGKVPYSTALQGAANIEPTFDNDQALYSTINSLVSQGIADLQLPQGSLYPTSDDVIYDGNAAEWIAFGNAINARIAIHQTKITPTMAATALADAQAALGNGQSALSFTNAQVYFGTTQTSANPWYQFNTIRSGYVSFATSTLASMLGTLNDPRFNIFIDTVGQTDQLGAYYGNINSPIEFITGEELLFIEAEANIISSGSVNAAAVTAYDSAVAINMEKLGIPHSAISTYITANPLPTSTTAAAIAQNATQEWIALYLNPEAWSVWRLTNSPTLTPVTGTAIPRRFVYPTSEMQLNGANLSAAYPGQTVTLYNPRIFWDN